MSTGSRLLLWLALFMLPAGAAIACPVAAFQKAIGAGHLPDIVAAARAMDDTAAGCAADQRAWAGRVVGLAYASEAGVRLARGASPAEAMTSVESGLRHGEPWPLLLMRGNLLQRIPGPHGRPNWAAASDAYQRALNDINDNGETAPVASVEMIETILRLAQQTAMVASGTVAAPPTRSGRPGGLQLRSVRGFVVVSVAQPIHFEFDATAFTSDGKAAVNAMTEMLRGEANPRILLIGHTDTRGTPEYNMGLSVRRAAAVRDHLIGAGYPAAHIQVEGHGESDKPRIEDPSVYTPEELHQIARRVELVRK